MNKCCVGLIDTGVAEAITVIQQRSFVLSEAEIKAQGHGTQVARIIVSHAADIQLLSAQAFAEGQPSSAAQIAEALDWLVSSGAQVVNMSFGLRHDREVLRAACQGAIEQGVHLLAATPPLGSAVYPAAYLGVLAISGDARCAPGVLSLLDEVKEHYGAAVGGVGHQPHQRGGGASYATAHATGLLASVYRAHVSAGELLRPYAQFRGREARAL